MKRFWLVLLSLGLIAAFSTQAMAVDVKFSGEYYAAGMYLDKTNLTKSTTGGNPSTAFYFQRLRVKTDFVVSPGLTLTSRADIMERAWGAARSGTGTTLDTGSAGTKAENENIAIDWAYLTYSAPVGIFSVGYMNDGATGTIFGNSAAPAARIKYGKAFGPATLNLAYTKVNGGEKSNPFGVPGGWADADNDKYGIEGVYTWKDGKAGLNINYYNYRANRPAATSNKSNYFLITPYATAKIGPVALQAEINYAIGEQKYEDGVTYVSVEDGSAKDKRDLQGISAWIDATADFKMFYVGGSVAYVSGNDPGTDKNEAQTVSGGIDWDPCLIMFNGDRSYWAGNLAGYAGTTTNGNAFANGYFAQLRGGVRPAEKFDIMASLSWAYADKTGLGATWEGRDYGYEIDVTGTYKITNNLSYMLGAGYWMVGKYYKGTTATNHDLADDFMVMNKLTLTF